LSKKTFEAAATANAHLIVQLKDNQLTLRQNVEAACNAAIPLSAVQTVDEKKRNRHETRTVAVFDAAPAVVETEWEPYVVGIIQVERSVKCLPTRNRPLEDFSGNVVLSVQPPDRRKSCRACNSQALGYRK